MASPITWRDIRAPDARAANSLVAQSSQTFNNSFEGINRIAAAGVEAAKAREAEAQNAIANKVFGQISNGQNPNAVNVDFTGLGARGADVASFLQQAKKSYVDNQGTLASTVGQQNINNSYANDKQIENAFTNSKTNNLDTSTFGQNIENGFKRQEHQQKLDIGAQGLVQKTAEASSARNLYEARQANDYYNRTTEQQLSQGDSATTIGEANAKYIEKEKKANLALTGARTYNSNVTGKAALIGAYAKQSNAKTNALGQQSLDAYRKGSLKIQESRLLRKLKKSGSKLPTNQIGDMTAELDKFERQLDNSLNPLNSEDKNKRRLDHLASLYGDVAKPSDLRSLVSAWGKGDENDSTGLTTALDPKGAGSNISAGDDRAKLASIQQKMYNGDKNFELKNGTKFDLSRVPFRIRNKALKVINHNAKNLAEDFWFNHRPWDSSTSGINDEVLTNEVYDILGLPTGDPNANGAGSIEAAIAAQKNGSGSGNLTGQAARIAQGRGNTPKPSPKLFNNAAGRAKPTKY